MSLKEEKTWIVNIAAVISVGTIFLYVLGWIYWSSFFNELGISFSIVDLTFEKMVSTTWVLLIVILAWVISVVINIYSSERSSIDAINVVFIFTTTLFIHSYVILKYIYFVPIMISVFLAYGIIRWIVYKKKINIPDLAKKTVLYSGLSICVIASIAFYIYRGCDDAEINLNNNRNDIEIEFKNKEILKARYLTKTSQMLVVLTEVVKT